MSGLHLGKLWGATKANLFYFFQVVYIVPDPLVVPIISKYLEIWYIGSLFYHKLHYCTKHLNSGANLKYTNYFWQLIDKRRENNPRELTGEELSNFFLWATKGQASETHTAIIFPTSSSKPCPLHNPLHLWLFGLENWNTQKIIKNILYKGKDTCKKGDCTDEATPFPYITKLFKNATFYRHFSDGRDCIILTKHFST